MLRRFLSKKTERYGELNTHDVLKFIALFTMTIDHIGAYCFPDQLWFRAVGHWHVPIWFFLVGYARSRTISQELALLAVLIALAQPSLAQAMLPLNVLVSIIICRLAVRSLEAKGWLTRYPYELVAACVMLWFPTFVLFEYGTMAVLIACWGALLRIQGRTVATMRMGLCSALLYITVIAFSEEYQPVQQLVLVLGALPSFWVLQRFTIRAVSLTPALHGLGQAVRFLARHSLYYYAIHRLALQALGAYVMLTGKVSGLVWLELS